MTYRTKRQRALHLRASCAAALSDHVLRDRHVEDEHHARFTIGKPGTGMYSAEIVVLSWGHLLVHGDIDTVIFGRCSYSGWRQVLDWMAGANYDYAEEKASIGATCSEMARSVDPDIACADILYWRRQKYLDAETARAATQLVRDGDVQEARKLIYEKTSDAELCTIGTCTNCRVFMAQAAITKLCALLDAEDMVRDGTLQIAQAAAP